MICTTSREKSYSPYKRREPRHASGAQARVGSPGTRREPRHVSTSPRHVSTSLSRDLFQAVLRPRATDAELLRVGRLAALFGGVFGVGIALLLPSVASALRIFYGVMTAALFVPSVGGLMSSRPSAGHARLAIVASSLLTLGLVLALPAGPTREWLPSAAGIAAACLIFATAWLSPAARREPGASIGQP